MIKIEIVADKVHEKSGIARVTGRPFVIREQDAYAYTVDRNGAAEKHPQKIVVSLDREQAAYKAGVYTILPQSFYVKQDRYGATLALGRLVLKALVAEAAAPKVATG